MKVFSNCSINWNKTIPINGAGMRVQLKACFYRDVMNAMNFLNEVVMRFPKAISFAPGRPEESFFDVAEHLHEVHRFAEYYATESKRPVDAVFKLLGQYGKTAGLITELLAAHLAVDEDIQVSADAIMVTNGCQEAMAILLASLFEKDRDVLLVSDPTYIGITACAALLDVHVEPVPNLDTGLDMAALQERIDAIRAVGKRPRAFYHVPDFNNPLGTSMSQQERKDLLNLAAREDLLIFEDNPYGQFAFDAKPAPTLKSMDTHGLVIYLGTVSKTLFPGLRLGYLVADQTTAEDGVSLAQALTKAKSNVSVNTSPILQAIVGGVLVDQQNTLKPLIAPKVDFYRDNRDTMVSALEEAVAAAGLTPEQMRCNRPAGGFFLTVKVPFVFDTEAVNQCAADYGVIVCPMRLFMMGKGRDQEIRLSFSYVTPAQIRTGIQRLVQYVTDRLNQDKVKP